MVAYSYAAGGDDWTFRGPDGDVTVRVAPRIRTNSGDTCRAMALADQGVILQPGFLVADDLAAEQRLLEQVLAGEREGYELEKRFLRPDNSLVYARLSLRAVRHSTGRVRMFLLLVEDISERLEAEARYRTIVENAPEAIMLFTAQGNMVDFNDNALRLLRKR